MSDLEQRIHRLPQRGWIIEIGVPCSALGPAAEHPVTFKATHMRDCSKGDVEEFESLDLDGAVTWLEQRFGTNLAIEPPRCPECDGAQRVTVDGIEIECEMCRIRV